MIVLQPTASLYWSSRTLMDLTSSTVRGRSSKSDSTTRKATFGLETTCLLNWHCTAVTSWRLTYNYETIRRRIIAFSTEGLLCLMSVPTTLYMWASTYSQVTQLRQLKMRSCTTTKWCSPRMTVTTTFRQITVHRLREADFGTTTVPGAVSTLNVALRMTSGGGTGLMILILVCRCSYLECGSSANSSNRQHQYMVIHN